MLKRRLVLLALHIIMVLSDKRYGSFNLTMTDMEVCRGPKHKECSVVKAQITRRNVIQFDMNVTQNVAPTKGKMTAITNGKEYIRFQMKKPCEHVFLKPLFYSFVNITKDCVILKGRYQFSADVYKLMQSFFGGSFVLGYWTFRSVFHSDECNILCLEVKVHMF